MAPGAQAGQNKQGRTQRATRPQRGRRHTGGRSVAVLVKARDLFRNEGERKEKSKEYPTLT